MIIVSMLGVIVIKFRYFIFAMISELVIRILSIIFSIMLILVDIFIVKNDIIIFINP